MLNATGARIRLLVHTVVTERHFFSANKGKTNERRIRQFGDEKDRPSKNAPARIIFAGATHFCEDFILALVLDDC